MSILEEVNSSTKFIISLATLLGVIITVDWFFFNTRALAEDSHELGVKNEKKIEQNSQDIQDIKFQLLEVEHQIEKLAESVEETNYLMKESIEVNKENRDLMKRVDEYLRSKE